MAADMRGQSTKHTEETPGDPRVGLLQQSMEQSHRSTQEEGLLLCPPLGCCWCLEHRSALPSSHQSRTE